MSYRLIATFLLLGMVLEAQIGEIGGGGPAILSGGSAGAGLRQGRTPAFFRYYAGVGGFFESGINPGVDSAGKAVDSLGKGVQFDFGVAGTRNFRRSSVTLNYRGDLYRGNATFDGSDHYLTLAYAATVTRRSEFSTSVAAGTSSRAYGGFITSQFVDPTAIATPGNELFDNRSYYAQISPTYTFRPSRRWAVAVGGDAFAVARASKLLVGTNGYAARANASYRLNRTSTVEFGYQFVHFGFDRAFGFAEGHVALVGYNRAIGRFWTASATLGGMRLETMGAQQVTFSPEIRALTGLSGWVEAIHRSRYYGTGGLSLVRRFARGSLSFDYRRSATPGNGLYLTSTNQSANAGWSRGGWRRWSYGLNGGWSQNTSIVQSTGSTYGAIMGGLGATYRLRDGLQLNTRLDFRKYSARDYAAYDRVSVRTQLTLVWSPGDVPLALW